MPRGTVAFDLIGTLFSLDAPRGALSGAGAPSATFDVWFSGALRDYFARSHSGPYSPLKAVLETTLERAARLTGWEIDGETANQVMGSLRELTPVDGAGTALEQLDEAGWKAITVTNGSRDLTEHLLERSGLRDHFATLISCDDLGVSKPHPRVYEEVKRHSEGVAWLVAAHAWDVAGAMNAGLRGAWISTTERVYPDFLPAPHVTADDLGSAVGSLVSMP